MRRTMLWLAESFHGEDAPSVVLLPQLMSTPASNASGPAGFFCGGKMLEDLPPRRAPGKRRTVKVCFGDTAMACCHRTGYEGGWYIIVVL